MDNWLKNTNVIKVLSLIFGIMLWLVVTLGANNTYQETPFEAVKTNYLYETEIIPVYDDNQYVVDIMTDKVQVTLKGDSSIIDQIRGSTNIDESKIFVNLEGYDTGTYEIPIEYSGFSSGVEVSIEPNTAHVNVETKDTKEFNIIVEKLGKEKDGYQTGEPIISPKKVYISGTKSQIEQVSFVKAYVNIDNINKSIDQEIQLRAIDYNGNMVDVGINPSVVNVQIPVSSPYSTVPLTYKINNYPSEGYAVESLNLSTSEVTLYGDKEILNNYNVYSGLDLDLSNITGNQAFSVDLIVNDDLLKVEPNSIDIEVRVVNSIIRNYIQIPIDIIELEEGFNVEIVSPYNRTDITLEGSAIVINSINFQDLQSFIDVSNLSPGEHKVLIQYNIPVLAKNIGEDKYLDVIITED